MTTVIRSPLLGGRKKLIRIMIMRAVQGMMTLYTKYNERRWMTNEQDITEYGFAQHGYETERI